MECMYKTEATNTFAEFKKYGWTLFKKISIIRTIIICAVFIVWGIYLNPLFLLTIPFVFVLEYFSVMRPLKKTFNSNKLMANAVIKYEFYDDYFIKTGVSGEDKIKYTDLNKIIETKTNVYLMIGNNYGCLLIKDNFPEGLLEFLRSKK